MKKAILLAAAIMLSGCSTLEAIHDADVAWWEGRENYVAPTQAEIEAKRMYRSIYYKVRSDMRWRATQRRIFGIHKDH